MKMKNSSCWRDNSNEHALLYSFSPPSSWTEDRIEAEQSLIARYLQGPESTTVKEESLGWLNLVKSLPPKLLDVLVLELKSGNKIDSISSSDWPNPGSIVVNLKNRFNTANHNFSPETYWRCLDDPHYCREEISQTANGIEHLIIT